MACLVYADATGGQVVFPLDKPRVSLGRNTDNDVVSFDLSVSRRHASIHRSGDGEAVYTIRDEDSTTGLFVNDRRVSECPLRDGDVIRLGDSRYAFVHWAAPPPESPAGRGTSPQAIVATLRGGALVAEVQEAVAGLRAALGEPAPDARSLDQRVRLVETRIEVLRRNLVHLERARRMMQTLYEVGKIVNSSCDRANLLEIVLDQAVQVVGAERGFLTLYDAGSGEFTRCAAIRMSAPRVEGSGPPSPAGAGLQTDDFSSGIALSVARTGEPVVTTDAQADERFSDRPSVLDLNIRSALCVPLVDRSGRLMGVIYVDTRASVVTFGHDDLEFLRAFANYAAIAIENAALVTEAAEKARMEEELRQARRMDEIKSDLIAIVSHDVRTPLTSIKSYAEILHDDLDDLEPARRRHFLDIINREADRLSRLVTNYLDLQKIEAGMMRLAAEPLEVAGMIGESLEAFDGAAREKGIALARELEPSMPALRGDRDRLLQVLANLLSNAVKFTPPGGSVAVAARSAFMKGRGPAVEIAVRDTGEGIPLEMLESLFKRFAQVEHAGEARAGAPRDRGTGLGLVFSREIVELHGGRIEVESAPGRGTTFRILLPLDGP